MLSGASMFESIPKVDHFNFFEESGGLSSPGKVIRTLKLKKKDVSVATKVPLSSVRYDDKMPRQLEERIFQWAIAISLVANFFNDTSKTLLWFHTPNPLLGGVSPIMMIRMGRTKKLLSFIQTALEENSSH